MKVLKIAAKCNRIITVDVLRNIFIEKILRTGETNRKAICQGTRILHRTKPHTNIRFSAGLIPFGPSHAYVIVFLNIALRKFFFFRPDKSVIKIPASFLDRSRLFFENNIVFACSLIIQIIGYFSRYIYFKYFAKPYDVIKY